MGAVRATRTSLAVAFAVLFLVPASSQAEMLMWYGKDGNGTVYQIDVETLQKADGIITFWDKRDHSQNRATKLRTTRAKMQIVCRDRVFRTLRAVDYDPKGQVISDEEGEVLWAEAPPGSIGATLIEKLCDLDAKANAPAR